jgi:hypothetical protein
MDSLEELERTYHFTRQERLLLEQAEADLSMWGMGHVTRFIDLNDVSRLSSGQQGKRILEQVRQGMEAERRKPTDYTGFRPSGTLRQDKRFVCQRRCPVGTLSLPHRWQTDTVLQPPDAGRRPRVHV